MRIKMLDKLNNKIIQINNDVVNTIIGIQDRKMRKKDGKKIMSQWDTDTKPLLIGHVYNRIFYPKKILKFIELNYDDICHIKEVMEEQDEYMISMPRGK